MNTREDFMSTQLTSGASLRQHPRLKMIFKAAESRQLTPQELEEYQRVVPEHTDRAEAAREIAKTEQAVVQKTVEDIFAIYPFEGNHPGASPKCLRDVRYVSAYATLAMLMEDPKWLEDKLLLWLRTILLAFEFPDRAQGKKVLFGGGGDHGGDGRGNELSPPQRSIYDTYVRLRENYREVLTPNTYQLMEPYLQQAVDILPASQ